MLSPKGLKTHRVDQHDYLYVDLWKENKKKRMKIHRLVALAFIGPAPLGLDRCLHRDGNHRNNHPSNLYWGTQSQNMYDRVAHGRHHNANKTHCPKGHDYTTHGMVTSQGQRACRTCRIETSRKFYLNQKLAAR